MLHLCDIITSKSCAKRRCFTLWLVNVLCATAACHFWRSEGPKMSRACHVFNICKCSSRYSGVHFWCRQTSKSAPSLKCFAHFDLQMCFSLKRRAIFRHLNFQKCSGMDVFEHFDLECASRHSGVPFFHSPTSKSAQELMFLSILTWNVLRARAAYHFYTAQLAKVLRNGCFWAFWLGMCFAPQRRTIFTQPNLQKCSGMDVFEHFDLECASRHSGVQFFLSALSSHLRTRRFSEPTFRPSRHTNHWKNTHSLSHLP